MSARLVPSMSLSAALLPRWLFVLLSVPLTWATPALANSYHFVDLGELTYPSAINNKDVFVLGTVSGGAIARNDHGRLLAVANGGSGDAQAINGRDDVAGAAGSEDYVLQAGVWPRGQEFEAVAVPAGALYSEAYGIAADGTVTGTYSDHLNFDDSRCFITTPDGATQALGERNGLLSCWATGVDSKHQVVGYSTIGGHAPQAFVWRDGVYHDLGFLPEGQYSEAAAINDRGEVVGVSQTTGGATHAVLWSGGVMKDIGVLNGYSTQATAVSSNGEIVGYATSAEDEQAHAARFSDGQVYLLENEVVNLGKFRLDYAWGVNSDGLIVGWATFHNKYHGFLLRPQ